MEDDGAIRPEEQQGRNEYGSERQGNSAPSSPHGPRHDARANERGEGQTAPRERAAGIPPAGKPSRRSLWERLECLNECDYLVFCGGAARGPALIGALYALVDVDECAAVIAPAPPDPTAHAPSNTTPATPSLAPVSSHASTSPAKAATVPTEARADTRQRMRKESVVHDGYVEGCEPKPEGPERPPSGGPHREDGKRPRKQAAPFDSDAGRTAAEAVASKPSGGNGGSAGSDDDSVSPTEGHRGRERVLPSAEDDLRHVRADGVERLTPRGRRGLLARLRGAAGTSIGAVPALLAVCCTDETTAKGFALDGAVWNLVAALIRPGVVRFRLDRKGLVSRKVLYERIDALIARLGLPADVDLEGLRALTGKEFFCNACCLTRREDLIMSAGTTPSLTLRRALCMTMCVPGLFGPIRYRGKEWVDGGYYVNYMMAGFPAGRTIGFLIDDRARSEAEIVAEERAKGSHTGVRETKDKVRGKGKAGGKGKRKGKAKAEVRDERKDKGNAKGKIGRSRGIESSTVRKEGRKGRCESGRDTRTTAPHGGRGLGGKGKSVGPSERPRYRARKRKNERGHKKDRDDDEDYEDDDSDGDGDDNNNNDNGDDYDDGSEDSDRADSDCGSDSEGDSEGEGEEGEGEGAWEPLSGMSWLVDIALSASGRLNDLIVDGLSPEHLRATVRVYTPGFKPLTLWVSEEEAARLWDYGRWSVCMHFFHEEIAALAIAYHVFVLRCGNPEGKGTPKPGYRVGGGLDTWGGGGGGCAFDALRGDDGRGDSVPYGASGGSPDGTSPGRSRGVIPGPAEAGNRERGGGPHRREPAREAILRQLQSGWNPAWYGDSIARDSECGASRKVDPEQMYRDLGWRWKGEDVKAGMPLPVDPFESRPSAWNVTERRGDLWKDQCGDDDGMGEEGWVPEENRNW